MRNPATVRLKAKDSSTAPQLGLSQGLESVPPAHVLTLRPLRGRDQGLGDMGSGGVCPRFV